MKKGPIAGRHGRIHGRRESTLRWGSVRSALVWALGLGLLVGGTHVHIAPSDGNWSAAVLAAAALPGDAPSVFFAPGIYLGGCPEGGVAISRSMRIVGTAGATSIDCLGSGRHFVIGASASVTISGLTLAGGVAGAEASGGCLEFRAGARGSVERCVLENCSAAGDGGAVAAVSAVVTVSDSAFRNNEAARSGGGLFLSNSSVHLTRVEVSNNVAGDGGGFAACNGSNVTLAHSLIEGNSASRDGGAALLASASHATCLTNVSVRDNLALANGGGFALHDGAALLITGSGIISHNHAGDSGGGMSLDAASSAALLDGILVEHNTAGGSGGGVRVAGGSALEAAQGVRFTFNDAAMFGAAVYVVEGSEVSLLDDVRVEENTGGLSGAVYVDGEDSSLVARRNILFSANRGTAPASFGGGIWANNRATVELEGCTLRGNIAVARGGGVMAVGFASVAATDSLFDSNQAPGGVGIHAKVNIQLLLSRVTMTRGAAIFSGSVGTGVGGAMVLLGVSLVAHDCDFAGNSAPFRAGGIMLIASVATLTNTRITDNTGGDGGGVFFWDTLATLRNCSVKGNRGNVGGGVMAIGVSQITLVDCLVEGNEALSGGGGMGLSMQADAAVQGCRMRSNVAGVACGTAGEGVCGGGAALVTGDATLSLLDSRLDGNSATAGSGGGILLSGNGCARVEASAVRGGSVVGPGGGVALVEEASLTLRDAEVAGNTATTRGGGLYVFRLSTVVLEGSNVVKKNAAGSDGGGVYATADLTFAGDGQTTIQGNTASYGGGVFVSGTTVRLDALHRLHLLGNSAGLDGGGLALMGGARIFVKEEECSCNLLFIGDGRCQDECLTKECKWDGGDCNAKFDEAGHASGLQCDRSKCTSYSESSLGVTTAIPCYAECFNAACDFGRHSCNPTRVSTINCPLFDAAMLSSLQNASPSPISVRGGTSAGFGRCDLTGCIQPSPPSFSALSPGGWQGAGRVGGGCVSLNASEQQWLFADTALGAHAGGVTVEAWVRPDASGPSTPGTLQLVVSGALFALGVRFDAQGGAVAELYVGDASLENCHGVDRVMEAATGAISDGYGTISNERVGSSCAWLIAPPNASSISLIFTSFLIGQDIDTLRIDRCTDPLCLAVAASGTFSGGSVPSPVYWEGPAVRVTLTPDASNSVDIGKADGFHAIYTSTPTSPPSASGTSGPSAARLGPGWRHIAASVDAGGGEARLFIDGVAVQTLRLANVSESWHGPPFIDTFLLGGPFGVTMGRGHAGWQEAGEFFGGSIDEVRVWSVLRSQDQVAANLEASCTLLSSLSPGMATCYSFDEASSEGPVSFADMPGGAGGGVRGAEGAHHLPWCRVHSDGGVVLTTRDGTPLWGYCVESPRLFASGYNYTLAALRDVEVRAARKDAAIDLVPRLPGCANAPLLISGNIATRHGGGLFYGSQGCLKLDAACFFDGLSGGMALTVVENNTAAMAGGGLFIDCAMLGPNCQALRSARLPLMLPANPEKAFSFQMRDNRAAVFGPDIATAPARLVVTTESASVIPGVESVKVRASLLDGEGSLSKGTSSILRVSICRAHIHDHVFETVDCYGHVTMPLSEVRFLAFDFVSGSIEVDVAVKCDLLNRNITMMHLAINGADLDVTPGLDALLPIHCRACAPGQRLLEDRGSMSWRCSPCDPGEYVVDPANAVHTCQPCPNGLECLAEGAVSPRTEGAVWEADQATGQLVLVKCPTGARKRSPASYLQQECETCPPSYFCEGGVMALRCPNGSYSAAGAASRDSCEAAVYVAISLVLPLSAAEFEDLEVQDGFRRSLAKTAGVEVDRVAIDSFEQISQRRSMLITLPPPEEVPKGPHELPEGFATAKEGTWRSGMDGGGHIGQRRAGELEVKVRIATVSEDVANQVVSRLTQAAIDEAFREEGLPPAVISVPPKVDLPLAAGTPIPEDTIVQQLIFSAAAFGAAMIIWGIVMTYLKRRRSISRRLIKAIPHTSANQQDLPHKLRSKCTAIKVLRSGAFGVVVSVDQRTGGRSASGAHCRQCALKMVHVKRQGRRFADKEMMMLEREAAMLSRINSPHVVKIYDSGSDSSVFWFLLELVDGQSLSEVLREGGPMSPVAAIQAMLDVCAALTAMHQLAIIHRDVKPGNIMVTLDGRYVLIDLGSTAAAQRLDGTFLEYDSTLRSSSAPEPPIKANWGKSFNDIVSTTYKPRQSTVTTNYGDLLSTTTVVASEVGFEGTPAYAAPETFLPNQPLTFAVDVWSVSVSLFEAVSGKMPFLVADILSAGAVIAGDLDSPSPDIRDVATDEIRAGLSTAFAKVVAKGLAKKVKDRYQTADELVSALYGCLVDAKERVYSTFISYRVFSEKIHATLLHEVLNNTVTPGGHRVVNYLDSQRLVKGEDWEKGFSQGLLNSLVALPMVSHGYLAPMMELQGSASDPVDNVLKELQCMHALMDPSRKRGRDFPGELEAVYPILIGAPTDPADAHYPYTGNFFADGSNQPLFDLPQKVTPLTTEQTCNFLTSVGMTQPQDSLRQATVSTVVNRLLALQAAQLWNHAELPKAQVSEALLRKAERHPPVPGLDCNHIRAIKAELLALVPQIHEVIDRSHAEAHRHWAGKNLTYTNQDSPAHSINQDSPVHSTSSRQAPSGRAKIMTMLAGPSGLSMPSFQLFRGTPSISAPNSPMPNARTDISVEITGQAFSPLALAPVTPLRSDTVRRQDMEDQNDPKDLGTLRVANPVNFPERITSPGQMERIDSMSIEQVSSGGAVSLGQTGCEPRSLTLDNHKLLSHDEEDDAIDGKMFLGNATTDHTSRIPRPSDGFYRRHSGDSGLSFRRQRSGDTGLLSETVDSAAPLGDERAESDPDEVGVRAPAENARPGEDARPGENARPGEAERPEDTRSGEDASPEGARLQDARPGGGAGLEGTVSQGARPDHARSENERPQGARPRERVRPEDARSGEDARSEGARPEGAGPRWLSPGGARPGTVRAAGAGKETSALLDPDEVGRQKRVLSPALFLCPSDLPRAASPASVPRTKTRESRGRTCGGGAQSAGAEKARVAAGNAAAWAAEAAASADAASSV